MQDQSTHVILERYVKNKRDMQEVEETITKQLGGEGHRCSFLRSRAYIRLRLAALYPTQFPRQTHAVVAYTGHISVTLLCDEHGKLITLRCLDPPVYQDEAGGGSGGGSGVDDGWDEANKKKLRC